jgi:hypothetical protein
MYLDKTEAVIIIACDGRPLSVADFFQAQIGLFSHLLTLNTCTCTRLKLLPSSLAMDGYYYFQI